MKASSFFLYRVRFSYNIPDFEFRYKKSPSPNSGDGLWNPPSRLRYVIAELSAGIASDLPTAWGNEIEIIILERRKGNNGAECPNSDLILFWTQPNIMAIAFNKDVRKALFLRILDVHDVLYQKTLYPSRIFVN